MLFRNAELILAFMSILLNICCKSGHLINESKVMLDTLVIRDYEFAKARIFFIDSVYQDYYDQGFSQDVQTWQPNALNNITELEVFITASYAYRDAFRAIAAINPDKYINLTDEQLDTVTITPGVLESRAMRALNPDNDYHYDPLKGILTLNQSIFNQDILAVSYKTIDRKIGEFSYELSADKSILVTRLIKPQALVPAYNDTWSLTMRNVYSIPDSVYSKSYFNIKIGFQTENGLRFTQNDTEQYTYLNLFGLDRVNHDGNYISAGDGIIDANSNIFNKELGLLFFPGLTPFNPEPGSRFQISDDTRVNIYNTLDPDAIKNNSRFRILCFYPSDKSSEF